MPNEIDIFPSFIGLAAEELSRTHRFLRIENTHIYVKQTNYLDTKSKV